MEATGYFVTGTDTGVGKTLVSAALVQHFRNRHKPAMYMKPVQTGCHAVSGNMVAPDVEWVQNVTGLQIAPDLADQVCPYRFPLPASPHLAAAQAGSHIAIDKILQAFTLMHTRHQPLVVEGAGGIMVPLNERETMLDLMKCMNLPIVLVCRPNLGTLNHSLLSLDRLRTAGLKVAGWAIVSTGNQPWGVIERDNVETLKRTSGAPLIGVFDFFADFESPARVREWLRQCPLLV
jgi:dethiobiotin synthetase